MRSFSDYLTRFSWLLLACVSSAVMSNSPQVSNTPPPPDASVHLCSRSSRGQQFGFPQSSIQCTEARSSLRGWVLGETHSDALRSLCVPGALEACSHCLQWKSQAETG